MIASLRPARPRLATVIALTVGIGVLPAIVTAPARAGKGANPKVFPVNARPNGLSYSEWAARWGEWQASLPVDAHPLFDTADCSAGQSGHVWFLGGTFTAEVTEPGVILGEADRACEIPSGTMLYFPIINSLWNDLTEGGGSTGQTEDELRELVRQDLARVIPESLSLVIDGEPVKDLGQYLVESPLYTIGPLPEENLYAAFDVPEGTTADEVTGGYFVMLKPLSVGTHTIEFTGAVDLGPIGPFFMLDILYTITVVPRGRY